MTSDSDRKEGQGLEGDDHVRWRRRLIAGLVVVLTLVFFLQAFTSSLQKSLTWDEPSFLSAGYTYLTRNDFQLNPSHPPFLQELMAFPLLFLDLEVPPEDLAEWDGYRNPVVVFARDFVYLSGNDVRQIAFWARLPILLLGTALVVAVYLWGRRLFGAGPALVGAAVTALSPNLLAHARLATEDLGCSALMFAAVWTFWRGVTIDRIRDWVMCGLVTGLALASKFTALLLGPIYLLIAGVLWLRRHPWSRSPRLLVGLGITGAVSFLMVGAAYNFTFDWSLYARGISKIYSDVAPGYYFYFLGGLSEKALWYYNPVAFLLKVPVPVLLLLIAGAIAAMRRLHTEANLFLLLPAAVVVGAACFDEGNFGLRRILPAFPFLFLFISQVLSGKVRRVVVAIVFILIGWTAVEAIRIHPDYLSYFNMLAGGPERGPYLLDDSNVDWGQDLPALARWQREHPDAFPLTLSYFGTALPEAYGVRARPMEQAEVLRPTPGYYAVSAHRLAWYRKLHLQTGEDIDWLHRYTPIDRAGYSIWIYRFE